VATAILAGGPGAVFWLWIAGIFGIATKYSEVFVAIKYRVKDHNGEMLGGKLTLSNGTSYSGSFKDGEFSGQGKIVYYDGSSFVGTFENGMRSHGKYTWATGESIEGVFVNNMPDPVNYITYTEAGEDGKTYFVKIRDGVIVRQTPYINVNEDEDEDKAEKEEADSDAVG